jgi:hypothetical protein
VILPARDQPKAVIRFTFIQPHAGYAFTTAKRIGAAFYFLPASASSFHRAEHHS